jgi:hypothetical protein
METMNMADNQSRVIIENGNGETTTYSAGNLKDALAIENAPKIKPTNQSRELPHLSIKVDVDVSEALTGLKAIQREAKEATKALRELEATKNSEPNVINVTSNTTNTDAKTLVETLERELTKRLRTRGV